MDASQHPFALAGYVAPYTLQGFSGTLDGAAPGEQVDSAFGLVQPSLGGSCDVCGAAIADATHFVDANGRKFKTGCDCAEHADLTPEQVAQIRAEKKEAARARRWERGSEERQERLSAFRARQAAAQEILDGLDWALLAEYAPEHEADYWAGRSAADDIRRFMRKNPTRLDVAVQIAECAIDAIEAGERAFSIEQPDASKSTHAPTGRQDLSLRLFRASDRGPSKCVDPDGRIFLIWGAHPELDTDNFTAVRATVKRCEFDSYANGAAVSVINRVTAR